MDSLYTGITTDVARRVTEHAGAGKQGAKSLRAKGPLALVYAITLGDRSLASRVEYAIKQLSKAEKEALVQEQPDAPQLLGRLELLLSEEEA
jgi:putative endonuclease